MVGPDYETPHTPMPAIYSEERENETFVATDEDLVRWWKIFEDPFLDCLLEETNLQSFDLYAALEMVYQARAQYYIQLAALWPEVDLTGFATRMHTSKTVANAAFQATIQDLYQVGFDATWEIDIFGGTRRAVNATCANWQATKENVISVQITVLSEVASTYVNICSFKQQQALALERVKLDQELVELTRALFESGLANEQQLDTAMANLERDQANLETFEILIKQAIYSLGVLVGRQPETLVEDFETPHMIPYAWGKVPTGLPSDLLRRRPDIRNAERLLAAATEQIGVAVADLFPRFTLAPGLFSNGNFFGVESSSISKLFEAASRVWTIGPAFNLPLFDFNRRIAMVALESSLQRQAFVEYERTIVSALQDVESALIAYFTEEERQLFLSRQVEENQRIFDLTSDLFQAGLSDYSPVLQAWETLLTSQNDLTLNQAALATNLIALYKALGGEWECIYIP